MKIIVGLGVVVLAWLAGCVVLLVALFATGVMGACHSSAHADWIVPMVFCNWLLIGIVAAVVFVRRTLRKDRVEVDKKTRDIVAEMRSELRAEKAKGPPLD